MGLVFSPSDRGFNIAPQLPAPASSTSCIPRPPFLDLPLDILHCIFDRLQPQDCIALALSCKDLHHYYFPRALKRLRDPSTTRLQRQAVHLMLEKQCGDRAFYCTGCDEFHFFSTEWRPTHYICRIKYPRTDSYCGTLSEFEPNFSVSEPYRVDYYLARLVMNRHLIGPPAGLPLECLEVEDVRQDDEGLKPYVWTQTWKAKIISDELIVSAVHTLSQLAIGDRFAQSFKEGLQPSTAERTWLCSHVPMDSNVRLPCVAKRGFGTTALNLFVPCRDVEGSCDKCLTDFMTTITWIDGVSEAGEAPQHSETSGLWSIVVTTYTQLGKCRSLNDWKWIAALGDHRSVLDQRKDAEYGFGSVRRLWQEL